VLHTDTSLFQHGSPLASQRQLPDVISTSAVPCGGYFPSNPLAILISGTRRYLQSIQCFSCSRNFWALSLREVVPHRTRLNHCPLMPTPDLRSIKRVLETITIGRWLSLQCTSINPLSRELLTFDVFCRREAPMQARASSFFSGARGTIVSGPAHFTSTLGPQVAVHIHRTS